MRTSDTTLADSGFHDSGNTLVNELIQYKQAYVKAEDTVSEDNPFLTYYGGGNQIELAFPSLSDATSEHNSLYIVAPDDPMQSFSLIARKVVPNKLGELSKDHLRRVLGTLLDNA